MNEVKVDLSVPELNQKKYTIEDAFGAYKIIQQVLEGSKNYQDKDNELLGNLKERLDRETALDSLDKLKEILDQEIWCDFILCLYFCGLLDLF